MKIWTKNCERSVATRGILVPVLYCRPVKNTCVMAMKENAAYAPVTSSQQPQDYIYAV